LAVRVSFTDPLLPDAPLPVALMLLVFWPLLMVKPAPKLGVPAEVDHVKEVALTELPVKLADDPMHNPVGPDIVGSPATGRVNDAMNVWLNVVQSFRRAVTVMLPPVPTLVVTVALGAVVVAGPDHPDGYVQK
jgi:hypothetical protein